MRKTASCPCLWPGLLMVLACTAGAWELKSEKSLGTLPGGATVWQRELVQNGQSLMLHGVSFRQADYHLRVVDVAPPAQAKLPAAAAAAGGVAGCNASYFHEDYRPLGLVISGGEQIHALERAKLLSGILAVRDEKPELVRPAAFKPGGSVTEAVQAGPWLVEAAGPVGGLDETKRARRTVVATDGRGRWALIATSPASLSAAAAALASGQAIPDWKPASALNLDGGSSTALWAANQPDPLTIPELGHVRNFLVIVPKD